MARSFKFWVLRAPLWRATGIMERAGAAEDIGALTALARYEAACAAALEGIAARGAALAPRIARARAAVAEAFGEAKRVEIVAERRAAEAHRRRADG
ncbi:MAG: hypothetical protein JKP92_05130 [Alphaproteobacteria bacterium]|nr:hypothetical protein [Alphaproteobacteria bacterium]